MEVKTLIFTFLLTITVKCVCSLPRDASVVKSEGVIVLNDDRIIDKPLETTEESQSVEENTPIVLRTSITRSHVSCPFDETTEAEVCNELCKPKGYDYGLCIGYRCSCV